MKDKEQNVKHMSIITSAILKSDTPDSNGRVYSKEALENAVKEYNENRGNKTQVEFGPYKGTEDGRLKEIDVESEMLKLLEQDPNFIHQTQEANKGIVNAVMDMPSDNNIDEIKIVIRGEAKPGPYEWIPLKDEDIIITTDEFDNDIDEEIKEQAHWLANKFSAREGYTTTEELLLEMGQFVKNRMLDKYNLEKT